MRRRNKERNKFIVLILMLFVLVVGIGYAVLTEQLTIYNTISYDSMKWDVGFTSAEDGFDELIDMYIESIEKESGATLEEMGITREEIIAEVTSEYKTVTPTTISTDKKT